MNKNQEFLKNTIILFIGKFATQFISLLLLPLYTHFLLTNDYGFVDLLQTYISLFVPILTLRIDSALFRFLLENRDNNDNKKIIITNIIIILIFNILVSLFVFYVINIFVNIKYFYWLLFNIIVLMISSIFLHILRGFGDNKGYSISSIITGFLTLLLNVIFIVLLHYNACSILVSSIIANLVCILYIAFKINIINYISFKLINKKEIKKILSYSFPMIPNSLSWWIVNVSDRSIISLFLGVSFNAIYTVSCKFSNILNSIFSIISMSWQESASLHIDDDDRDIFFSNTINEIFIVFATISLLLISILPFFYNFLIGDHYLSSYNYIPIILYANSWNVLIGLIGGIYVAKKETKKIASTTIFSAIINIVINLLLIKYINLYAACISTLISYFAMSIYRYFDCRKYVNLKLDFSKIIIYSFLFFISSIIYIKKINIYCIFNLFFVLLFSFYLNKVLLIKCKNYVLKRIGYIGVIK